MSEVHCVIQWRRFYRKCLFRARAKSSIGQGSACKKALRDANPGPRIPWRVQHGLASGQFESLSVGLRWRIVSRWIRTRQHLSSFARCGSARGLTVEMESQQADRQQRRAHTLAQRAASGVP